MNLNKRAMEYAKKNHYYCISKIKEYLMLEDKEFKRLKSLIPKSICPHCGKECDEIEYSEDEYSSERWVYCDECGECYDDYKYINAKEDFYSFNWFDEISVIVSFDEINDFKRYSWIQFCNESIDKSIRRLRMLSK